MYQRLENEFYQLSLYVDQMLILLIIDAFVLIVFFQMQQNDHVYEHKFVHIYLVHHWHIS
jgi:hypothetical protein